MNEVLADIYAITGDKKYIELAKRFNHRAVFDPLENHQDRLTGLHANTQIPKIIGLERIAALTRRSKRHTGAEFFWDTVTQHRSVAFGGNSVSEHFNDPNDFSGMLEHREGPETCNTYNMLRLTETAVRRGAQGRLCRLLRARPLQPHPGLDPSREARLRLFHADPAGSLPRLFAARASLLVLRRHGHGEPRAIWRVHLRQGEGRDLRESLHRFGTDSRDGIVCVRRQVFPYAASTKLTLTA